MSNTADMQKQMEELRAFMARRFDEISMEINATSQQLDLAESGLAKQFTDVMTTLSTLSFQGNGTTAVNTGVELRAVIDHTEQAANTIMDSAERITSQLQAEGSKEKIYEIIRQEVETILMACTFQDLTSQRINKALENLQLVENRLSDTMEKLGIKVEVSPEYELYEAEKTRLTNQSDIDALFN